MTTAPLTANERFKRQQRRTRWWAIGAAVAFHAALFLLMPSFGVDFASIGAAGPRMAVVVRDWRAPVCVLECGAAYAPYDPSWGQPDLTNAQALNLELPRLYPPLLWRYREPSYGVFEIAVSRGGRVRSAVFLDGSDNGGEEALLELVRMMRYEPVGVQGRRTAVVAVVEVEIERPR